MVEADEPHGHLLLLRPGQHLPQDLGVRDPGDRLVELLPGTPPVAAEFGVLTPHRELQDPKVRLFIEFAARELKGALG